MANKCIRLKAIPSGYYANYVETIQKISDSLAVVSHCQIDINTSKYGNFQYFLRCINTRTLFDVMIPRQAYVLLKENIKMKEPNSLVIYCNIYEYIYGKDTIKVYEYADKIEAIGEVNNKEWQEDFKNYE